MTIKIHKKNVLDLILVAFGKKRAILLPNDIAFNYSRDDSRYVYCDAQKEPFLKALLRSSNTPLPDGWIYIDEINHFKKG